MNPEKARLYKTARARIAWALFPKDSFVAVRFFGRSPTGTLWFEVAAEKFPDPVPPLWYKSTCYPEHHLTEFCL